VSDELVRYVLTFGTERLNGIGQVRRRPRCDSRNQQVQATRPMHLVLVGAIAELAALTDEDSAARAVDSFTVVQSALLPTTKLWIQQEFEDEHGLFQLANLIECPGDLVLTWIGGQLARDQRRRTLGARRRWSLQSTWPILRTSAQRAPDANISPAVGTELILIPSLGDPCGCSF
jgi:hypothetical protein